MRRVKSPAGLEAIAKRKVWKRGRVEIVETDFPNLLEWVKKFECEDKYPARHIVISEHKPFYAWLRLCELTSTKNWASSMSMTLHQVCPSLTNDYRRPLCFWLYASCACGRGKLERAKGRPIWNPNDMSAFTHSLDHLIRSVQPKNAKLACIVLFPPGEIWQTHFNPERCGF